MTDAVALAECLSSYADTLDGLAAYDRRRRRTTQRLAAMSARANRLAQVKRLLPLRDSFIRLALALGPPA